MTTTDDETTAVPGGLESGSVDAAGVQVHWESRGTGGTPLVLVHGGFGTTAMFAGTAPGWAADRRVVSVELQGHGHTALGTAPLSFDALGDQVAAVVREVVRQPADVLGYSLGGLTSLRTALLHPGLVRRLVLVAVPCRRTGWYPEIAEGMGGVSRAAFEMMRRTPLYDAYAAVAPVVDDFPRLMDALGVLLGSDYDWTAEVADLVPDTLLVYADGDSVPVTHAAEFFGLLGGGLRDGGWDGSGRPRHRLAVLPGRTHHDVLDSPALPPLVREFTA
ncbi:alpha/beta fold hydrolase [Kineococcus rubinsiae]|uniref:alpha/beta fold hydrolase n=1 Tax=Kineococcus rubinsiae TaxID=2609562 RepID=UPI001431E317|nr:alpha/beta hydrolase [Kineococcus rubinsiae]NIZ90924.1 alpha/beta hydrolase [Kineococcus rubinsiae]